MSKVFNIFIVLDLLLCKHVLKLKLKNKSKKKNSKITSGQRNYFCCM